VRSRRELLAAPVDRGGCAVERLDQAGGVHPRPVGQLVARLDRVVAPQGQGVEAERVRDPGQVRLDPERELRVAEAAVGATGRQVGVDAQRVEPHVRDAVGTGRGDARRVDDVGAVLDVRTGVPVQGVLERGERAVAAGADLEPSA
jgi:hypothetical protein